MRLTIKCNYNQCSLVRKYQVLPVQGPTHDPVETEKFTLIDHSHYTHFVRAPCVCVRACVHVCMCVSTCVPTEGKKEQSVLTNKQLNKYNLVGSYFLIHTHAHITTYTHIPT